MKIRVSESVPISPTTIHLRKGSPSHHSPSINPGCLQIGLSYYGHGNRSLSQDNTFGCPLRCKLTVYVVWKPQAYSAPRIVAASLMILGLLFTGNILHSLLSHRKGFVLSGCRYSTPVSYDFFLLELRYSTDYTLPLTTCANCTTCGISDFLKVSDCTSLVVRAAFSGLNSLDVN